MELIPSDPLSAIRILLMCLWFGIAVLIAFVLPGRLVMHRLLPKAERFEKFTLYLATGLLMWTVQGLSFGYIGQRWLTYLYLLLCIMGTLREKTAFFRFSLRRAWGHIGTNLIMILVFAAGMSGQLFQLVPGGFITPSGIRLTVDDTVWHLALTSQLVRRFPPDEPSLSGIPLHNYHFLSNLVTADMVRVFRLPLLTAQFVFMYAVVSFLLGALTYVLVRRLGISRTGGVLAAYLVYFSSDIIYLLTFVTRRVFEFTVLPLEDGTMFLENPPRAFSHVVALTGMYFLYRWLKERRRPYGLLAAAALGLVIGFKVHTGLMVLMGLAGLSVYFLWQRSLRLLWVPALSLFVSLLIYLPTNTAAGAPVFAPFEMSRMFTVQPLLNMSTLELRRRTYLSFYNPLRALQTDLIMLAVFLMAQFGLKNLGWLAFPAARKRFGTAFTIFLYACIIGTAVFATLFIQPVAFADIFNSYIAASVILTILSVVLLADVLGSSGTAVRLLLVAVIAALTLPRWISRIVRYADIVRTGDGVHIPTDELTAMRYVRDHTDPGDVVLVVGYSYDAIQPYVTTFSGRDTFYSGLGLLGTHGITYGARTADAQALLTGKNGKQAADILLRNNIRILYIYGNAGVPDPLKSVPHTKIFGNGSNTVYRLL